MVSTRIVRIFLTGARVGCPASGNVNSGTLDLVVTEFVSVDSSFSKANGDSTSNPISISADGRTVALVSEADNLVAYDFNARQDVFVRKPLKY